jgi:two-component system chemotaxis response regulator CheY
MPIKFENLSVLVVEDAPPMLELVSGVLNVLGVRRVHTARDGEQGWERFQREKPDIVITDWLMEPIDGIELTLKIRRDTLSADRLVPIIIMTGYSAITRVSLARDIGVTEFLVKPFTANDLARRIQAIIERPRDFVDSGSFFGPDRRRRRDVIYKGPDRRDD